MKKNFILGGVSFFMNSKYLGGANNVWSGDRYTHAKHLVTISTAAGRTSFTFYDSAQNWWDGVRDLNEDGLKNALESFLSDASCYDCARDFNDFCEEMGYTIENIREARRAWAGCKRHSEAAQRIFNGSTSAIWDDLTA